MGTKLGWASDKENFFLQIVFVGGDCFFIYFFFYIFDLFDEKKCFLIEFSIKKEYPLPIFIKEKENMITSHSRNIKYLLNDEWAYDSLYFFHKRTYSLDVKTIGDGKWYNNSCNYDNFL